MMRNALFVKSPQGLKCVAKNEPPHNPFNNGAAELLGPGSYVIEIYYVGEDDMHRDPDDKRRLNNRMANLPTGVHVHTSPHTGHVGIAFPGEW